MLQDIWKKLRLSSYGQMNKKNQLLIILLVGILLVVIAIPNDSIREEASGETKGGESESQSQSYTQQMERRLENVLKKVEGVGNVDVMITYKSTSEKVVEKDAGRSDTTTEETTVYNDTQDGAKSPYVRMERMPEVEGVVLIAEGGNNAVVVKNITEAVQALFDVDTHKIKIMKGG